MTDLLKSHTTCSSTCCDFAALIKKVNCGEYKSPEDVQRDFNKAVCMGVDAIEHQGCDPALCNYKAWTSGHAATRNGGCRDFALKSLYRHLNDLKSHTG